MKNTILILLCLSSNICFSQNNKVQGLPELTTTINDFEDILSDNQEFLLNTSIRYFYERTQIPITIATVNSIQPYSTFSDFSLALAKETKSACILIVVSKSLRNIHIQNCDDVVAQITDEETKAIIDDFMIPKFKNNDFFNGLLNGLAEIKKEFN